MSRTVGFAFWLLAVAVLGCSTDGKVEPGREPSTATAAPGAPGAPSRLASAGPSAPALSPDDVTRILPEEARRKVQAGQALLVCAYPDDAKYETLKLEGSISLHELERKLDSLARDQEIIFYCA